MTSPATDSVEEATSAADPSTSIGRFLPHLTQQEEDALLGEVSHRCEALFSDVFGLEYYGASSTTETLDESRKHSQVMAGPSTVSCVPFEQRCRSVEDGQDELLDAPSSVGVADPVALLSGEIQKDSDVGLDANPASSTRGKRRALPSISPDSHLTASDHHFKAGKALRLVKSWKAAKSAELSSDVDFLDGFSTPEAQTDCSDKVRNDECGFMEWDSGETLDIGNGGNDLDLNFGFGVPQLERRRCGYSDRDTERAGVSAMNQFQAHSRGECSAREEDDKRLNGSQRGTSHHDDQVPPTCASGKARKLHSSVPKRNRTNINDFASCHNSEIPYSNPWGRPESQVTTLRDSPCTGLDRSSPASSNGIPLSASSRTDATNADTPPILDQSQPIGHADPSTSADISTSNETRIISVLLEDQHWPPTRIATLLNHKRRRHGPNPPLTAEAVYSMYIRTFALEQQSITRQAATAEVEGAVSEAKTVRSNSEAASMEADAAQTRKQQTEHIAVLRSTAWLGPRTTSPTMDEHPDESHQYHGASIQNDNSTTTRTDPPPPPSRTTTTPHLQPDPAQHTYHVPYHRHPPQEIANSLFDQRQIQHLLPERREHPPLPQSLPHYRSPSAINPTNALFRRRGLKRRLA